RWRRSERKFSPPPNLSPSRPEEPAIQWSRALALMSVRIVATVAACTPEPSPAPASPDAKAAAESDVPADPLLAGTDASAVIRHDATDPAGFDRKAFAGTFAGILPCAGCPGVETSVEIRADGSYSQAEVRPGNDAARTTATWTVDSDGGKR